MVFPRAGSTVLVVSAMAPSAPKSLLTVLVDACARVRAAHDADELQATAKQEAALLADASGSEEDHLAARTQLEFVTRLCLDNLRLRDRAQNAVRSREVLLASISHDLRNPLNTFAMSAGLLRDDLERNDVDVQRALGLSTRMERATTRMQALIEDLLEASRIDARKLDLLLRVETPSQLVRDAITAAAPLAVERRTTLATNDLDDDLRVSVDRLRTLDALAKVIAWSIKTTGDGGTLRIGVERRDDMAVIVSRSQSPNATIPPPSSDGRVDPMKDTRGGLALFIARGLAEAQGGSLRIESDGGITIEIALPLVT